MADRRILAKEALLVAKRLLEKEWKRLEDVGWSIAHAEQIIQSVVTDEDVDLGRVTPHASRPGTDVLEEEARFGVAALSLVPNPDGSWNVRVNGGRAFRLQPKLGALLRILAAAGGAPDNDGLVGWKSYEHVATTLGRAKGRGSRADVIQAMWKLREAFTRESQNRFLIQTGPHGIRFALRGEDGT